MWIKTHKEYVIIGIWIAGIILASTQIVKSRAVPFPYGNETYYDCREVWSVNEGKLYTIAIFIITFAMPAMALIFVYGSVGLTIMRHNPPGNPDSVRDVSQWNIKIKVITSNYFLFINKILCFFRFYTFYSQRIRFYSSLLMNHNIYIYI